MTPSNAQRAWAEKSVRLLSCLFRELMAFSWIGGFLSKAILSRLPCLQAHWSEQRRNVQFETTTRNMFSSEHVFRPACSGCVCSHCVKRGLYVPPYRIRSPLRQVRPIFRARAPCARLGRSVQNSRCAGGTFSNSTFPT